MGLLIGGLLSFYINYQQINSLNTEVVDLQSQITQLSVANETITIYQNSSALADIYASVWDSVVLIQGTTSTETVQGSGFVYNYSGSMVIITNFHVVYDTTTLSVTFSDGRGYAGTVLGTDPYADLAVVSLPDAPADAFKPVDIVGSSNLRVGEQVIAIGNPYGLVGSLTTGVVSALGRTIQEEDYTANFSIANIIQTSTPINPGNSGGPLLNAVGHVVGITTAIVSDSQGLGFAIPSDTILKEIGALVSTGTYTNHSYMGIRLLDMSYNVAQEEGTHITYGVLITAEPGQDAVVPRGPSDGKLRPNDIIVALNGTRIVNSDDLASYLEVKTLPRDLVVVTVFRDNASMDVNVILGTRPPPPV
jgi:S1-C subfamily serine protease